MTGGGGGAAGRLLSTYRALGWTGETQPGEYLNAHEAISDIKRLLCPPIRPIIRISLCMSDMIETPIAP